MPSDQFSCTCCPLCITNGGHTWPTAFTKLSTVDVTPMFALTVLYKGSFTLPRYTYTVHIADVEASESEGEDGEESEEQDLHNQFDDIYDDPTKRANLVEWTLRRKWMHWPQATVKALSNLSEVVNVQPHVTLSLLQVHLQVPVVTDCQAKTL